jgi:hypothetical protein
VGAARGASSAKRRAGLAALVLAVAFAGGAANASALIVSVEGRTLSYLPIPGAGVNASRRSKTPLAYHGGPVMASNTNYAFYWDPSGGAAYPAGYEFGLNRYFEDLAHDSGGLMNTDSVLTQYGDGAGEFANYKSLFGEALIDTNLYPVNGCAAAPICLTDAQLRAEITSYVEAHKLPTDLQHEYFLLTPPASRAASKPQAVLAPPAPNTSRTAPTTATCQFPKGSSCTRTTLT